MDHPWPMSILTKEAGQSRKLIVKPVDICPRSNFRPDADGHLRHSLRWRDEKGHLDSDDVFDAEKRSTLPSLECKY